MNNTINMKCGRTGKKAKNKMNRSLKIKTTYRLMMVRVSNSKIESIDIKTIKIYKNLIHRKENLKVGCSLEMISM